MNPWSDVAPRARVTETGSAVRMYLTARQHSKVRVCIMLALW